MAVNPKEVFALNKSINATIHEILTNTPEPSRSRMRKAIRGAGAAARRHGDENTDSAARHIFREFLIGYKLNCNGFRLEYSQHIDGMTPDWYDAHAKLLLEVLTCERGGSSHTVERASSGIADKVEKYSDIVVRNGLFLVIAVHGDFESFSDAEDCESAISKGRLFELYSELSGVIYFAESTVSLITMPDGSTQPRQQYGYVYFANPSATPKLDLSVHLCS